MKSITRTSHLIFAVLAFAITFGISVTSSAQARDLASEVNLERSLEERVKPLVERFDASAIVRVNVSFKRISSPLPGTALDVRDFSGSSEGGTLRDSEISSVRITVFSAKSSIPTWLSEEISLVVPGARPRIELKALSPDAQEALLENKIADPMQVVQEAMNSLTSQARTLSLYIFFGLGGILLLGIGLGTLVAFSLQKKRALETSRLFESRLIPALQNIGQGAESGNSSRPTVLQATLTAPAGGFQGQNSQGPETSSHAASGVAALNATTLEAVLSDCYWCHQDTYASWLWSTMTPAQREKAFASPQLDREYLKWIQSLPREKLEEHFNPVYLSPAPLNWISQTDLARWVEKSPAGFHDLSPMRQKTLPISLKTRLTCAAETRDDKTKLPPFPERASPKRVLPIIQQFGELSFEDETTLLHNPLLVAESLRPQIRSLVWLALKPLEYRQKALAEHSAEALASAWWGAEEVLARLTEALPEKKRQMLEGYLKFAEINRKTGVFVRLVDAGLDPRPVYSSENPVRSARAA